MSSFFQHLVSYVISFRLPLLTTLVAGAVLVGACMPPEQPAASSITPATAEAAPDGAPTDEDGPEKVAYQAVDPLPETQALPPVRISIPEANLESPVEAMGWTVSEDGGQRTTRWVVPDSAAGWHINSAGVGAGGNMILSGHQVQGDAVFVPLSLGGVAVGQHVLVQDEDGVVFVYRVVDVSDPIPTAGANDDEQEEALAYVAASEDALLTLITGWPDFTTTHRIFARAELLGVQK